VANFPGLSQPFAFDYLAYPQNVTLAFGVALTLALWGAAVITGQARVFVSRAMIAFGVFTAWAAVATLAAFEPLRALFGASTSPLSLVMIVAYSAVFFLTIQLVDSRQRLRVLTWCVVGSAALVAFLALLQQFFGVQLFGQASVAEWMLGRGFSTMGNPDFLGTYLVLPAVLGAFMILYEERTSARIVAAACSAVILIALVRTLTRGAWAAVLVGAVLAVVLLWRAWAASGRAVRNAAIVGVSLAIVIAVALVASNPGDLSTRFSALPGIFKAGSSAEAINSVSSDRINLWKSSLLIASQRPLTGTGPASFELGWYPNAIKPSSVGGEGGLADDPHSLPVYILATMGIPGLLAYLVAAILALVIGARNSIALTKRGDLSGKSVYYVAWFVGAVALQVALAVAAINASIIMYCVLGFAVLLRPSAHPVEAENRALASQLPALASFVLALALVVAWIPQISAETTLAGALAGARLDDAQRAARSVRWNRDIQKAYFHLRVLEVNQAVDSGSSSARAAVEGVSSELADAATGQPRELYYPSVRAQVLSQASGKLGDTKLAEEAVQAADAALAIMPANIPTRVNKALALYDLKRYKEMADTLRGHWENELSSPYPGILYAIALASSGNVQESDATFTLLEQRFPSDSSIEQSRQQLKQQLQPKK
jgi:putative inorganic carbon (HCO3(-)) transporter